MPGTTEDCKRCRGKGYLEIRLGLEGQDPREIGQANIEWGERYPSTLCNACHGTGLTRKRDTQKSKRIENTDLNTQFTGEHLT